MIPPGLLLHCYTTQATELQQLAKEVAALRYELLALRHTLLLTPHCRQVTVTDEETNSQVELDFMASWQVWDEVPVPQCWRSTGKLCIACEETPAQNNVNFKVFVDESN